MESRNCAPDRKTRVWLELLRETDAAAAHEADELTEPECILLALAQAVEQRDRQTAGHCERLALMSVALGIAMELSRPQLLALYRGGYLHDVGKIGMPDSILFKPGVLSPDEWALMRSHPARGEEICRPMKSLAPVLPIIRSHHERWDGAGYPDRLCGPDIPLLARVLQVADIYDALTTVRPYKRAFSPREALETMCRETDRGWRDPEIMGLFLRLHRDVISELADQQNEGDRGLTKMRASMRNLRHFLESDRASVVTPGWCGEGCRAS